MEQVQDVDISKLSFLQKSKALMQESDKIKGDDIKEPNMALEPKKPVIENRDNYEDRVKNSNLSSNVKEAMLKNRIVPQENATQNQKLYTAEEMNNMGSPPPQQVNEERRVSTPQNSKQSNSFDREDIKGIIKEVLAEMMVNTITENSVKKTIKTLMNEGIIKAKKKRK